MAWTVNSSWETWPQEPWSFTPTGILFGRDVFRAYGPLCQRPLQMLTYQVEELVIRSLSTGVSLHFQNRTAFCRIQNYCLSYALCNFNVFGETEDDVSQGRTGPRTFKSRTAPSGACCGLPSLLSTCGNGTEWHKTFNLSYFLKRPPWTRPSQCACIQNTSFPGRPPLWLKACVSTLSFPRRPWQLTAFWRGNQRVLNSPLKHGLNI